MPGRFLRICMNSPRSHQCTKYSLKKNSPRQSNILGSKWNKCNTPEVVFCWKRQFWERNDVIIRALCCDSIILRRNISLYNYFVLFCIILYYIIIIFLRNDRLLSRRRCYISGALGQSECLFPRAMLFPQCHAQKKHLREFVIWSGSALGDRKRLGQIRVSTTFII